jgi:pSer/pThr/pTyr-binding forkhead associated (FHA) protein
MNAILVFFLRLIFVLLSYIFIGWIGYTIFTDLKQTGLSKKLESFPLLSVQMKLGREQIEKQFEYPEIVIGRDTTCDFTLDDDTISLHHSKLSFHHRQWWLEDLGSTNGSYVNNTLVEEPVVLTSGDQLRLGRINLKISINSTLIGENNE